MTDKPEKIVSGRFELEDRGNHCILWYWLEQKKQHVGIKASRSEFQQLARGILKDEIERLNRDIKHWKTIAEHHKKICDRWNVG